MILNILSSHVKDLNFRQIRYPFGHDSWPPNAKREICGRENELCSSSGSVPFQTMQNAIS